MSGSGGGRDDSSDVGGGAGGRTGGGAAEGSTAAAVDPCDLIHEAPLNSPKLDVLRQVRIGDELRILLEDTGGRPVLVVRDQAGGIAGTLTHRGYQTIIECIRRGNRYMAQVTRISGGVYEVRVSRVA